MRERLIFRYLVALCLLGFTIYLLTSSIPTAKFHVFDVGTYAPTENARYVRTVLELAPNLSFVYPHYENWTEVPCSLDYSRSIAALNPIDMNCFTYNSVPEIIELKPVETVWFLTIYGNSSEAFHSMESCYIYFGWKVLSSGVEEVNVLRTTGLYPINMSVNVRKLHIKSGADERVVLYWLLYRSPYKDAREGTFLTRISSPVKTDYETALENTKMFAADAMEEIFITEDVDDTVFEYYFRELGILFILLLAVIYMAGIFLFFRPDILFKP